MESPSFGHWNFSRKPKTPAAAKNDATSALDGAKRDELESTYISLIDRYLKMHLVDNARWLAERCVAEFQTSSKAAYWLAMCLYRSGDYKAARYALDTTLAPKKNDDDIDYLRALCSIELEDYSRAEECLLRKARVTFKEYQNTALNLNNVRGNNILGGSMSMDEWLFHSRNTTALIPHEASGLFLLGKVFRMSNRRDKAVQFFKASLEIDPFLWSSMEALAELGALETSDLQPHQVALMNQSLKIQSASKNNKTADSFVLKSTPVQSGPPDSPNPALDDGPPQEDGENGVSRVHFQTPGLTPIQPASVSRVHRDGLETPSGQTPNPSSLSFLVNNNPPHTQMRHSNETPVFARRTSTDEDSGAPMERRQRLFSPTENSNFLSNNTVGKSPTEEDKTDPKKPVFDLSTMGGSSLSSLEMILRLLSSCATLYQHACQYRCKEAIQAAKQLSWKQQNTGWVLHQQGKAHLELNEFAAAQRCLEQMQNRDPNRMDGLELLSTVYWHLKKEVELSYLAQRTLDINRLSPITWCVVGNCFSLQKDHETALVFFRRALQLDPHYTYIHTLSGYEYMANEDFDKAIVCFRKALRINERHYNAWYGLGAIFHRQEKYDLAEYHFERAVQLHPTSSILLCNLGIAQYANGKAYQALDTLAQAFRLDPQNPQARFQRASIYAALHRPSEAYAELVKVRDSAPREAAVHFAMGKVLKKLGRPQEAITSFLTAMDLDPKENQAIKAAMDKVGEPDVGEESLSSF